jgi:hypothetical protein
MRAKQLKVAIKTTVAARKNILIVGPPAIGKTKIAEQVSDEICAQQGGAWMICHPVTDDPSDWKGLGFPSDDRKSATFLPYGNLLALMNADKLLICILDDVGQACESVQAALMQVVEERTINGLKISDNVVFILCTNRKGDKAAVRGVIEPLKSRCIPIDLEVNTDDWIQWANTAGMPPELIAFAKLRPNLLHDFKPTTDMTNSPSPRGFEAIGRLMMVQCPKEIEYEMFRGCCGDQMATEYCGFLRTYRDMPDPEAYINDNTKPLPEDESTLYALTAALAARANKTNLQKVYDFAMRLDAEYSTFMVFSMIQRDKKLAQHAGMAVWSKKFAPYLMN